MGPILSRELSGSPGYRRELSKISGHLNSYSYSCMLHDLRYVVIDIPYMSAHMTKKDITENLLLCSQVVILGISLCTLREF